MQLLWLRPRPDVPDIPWARYGQDDKMIETKRLTYYWEEAGFQELCANVYKYLDKMPRGAAFSLKQYDGKKLEWIRAIINAWLEEAPDGEISGWADETFTTFRKLNAPRTDEEETKPKKRANK